MMTKRYIYFNTRDTMFRIELSQIVHFAADKNYTLLQLNNGQKLMFTFSLQKAEQYLKEKLGDESAVFARIGKSYIINLTYLFQIDIVKQKVRLLDTHTQREFILPVSKEACRNLRNLYIKTK